MVSELPATASRNSAPPLVAFTSPGKLPPELAQQPCAFWRWSDLNPTAKELAFIGVFQRPAGGAVLGWQKGEYRPIDARKS